MHSPVFIITVEVNGIIYRGEANSKKKAKLLAAEKALSSFIQLPNSAEAKQALGGPEVVSDFTSDQAETGLYNDFQPTFQTKESCKSENDSSITNSKTSHKKGKNPVTVLNEIRPGTKYQQLSEPTEKQSKHFKINVTVDGRNFEGCGRNKRQAKARAAQAALQGIFNLQLAASNSKKGCLWVFVPS